MNFRSLILSTATLALVAGPAPTMLTDSANARSIVRPPAEALCQIYAGTPRRQYRPRHFPPSTGAGTGPQRAKIPVTPPPPVMHAPPPAPRPSGAANQEASSDKSVVGVIAPRHMPGRYMPVRPQTREKYDGKAVAGIKAVVNEPVSTFSVDVDTGSYANVRRFLNKGQKPPESAVRTEEMVNYFRYDYPLPAKREQPFSITTDMAVSPWNSKSRLLRIGLRGYDLDYNERPAANLVFLVDVSGSMGSPDKLPLVKSALSMLADQIRPQDRVSIVVYAGAAGKVLSPCNKPEIIKQALDGLRSGGSTAGGAGLKLAYATAQQNFSKGSVNRILVATDGDFNVGIRDRDELKKYVAKQRDGGVTLTTLGFGTGNYNEALMEQIANVGNGNYAYIDSAMEARKVLTEEMSSTLFTIAKDVKIQIEFNPAYVSEYRLIGYENRLLAEEDFDNDRIDAGDIGASHQVTALYEVIPAGTKGWLSDRRYGKNNDANLGKRNGELGFIKLRYKLPSGSRSRLIQRPLTAAMIAHADAPRGDMAFATAVAAFGQKLRGDKYLGDFSYGDIRILAGSQNKYWRQEFVKLTELAGSGS
ncbi:MAG: VWA domain-containing protein [Sphingorhabdus sp.]